MKANSAGILLYKQSASTLHVLLVHPGGPFWAKKDAGAWSIPKGEYEEGDDALEAAKREFLEELGSAVAPEVEGELGSGVGGEIGGAASNPIRLGDIRQKSGKVVTAWAVEGDLDAANIRSNTFSMEWPPRSGRFQDFPEVDRAEWFTIDEAREKMNPAQVEFLDRLLEAVGR